MGISETKKQIVIDNYFKNTCDVNTSIKEAFTKGFEVGLTKAVFPKDQYENRLKADMVAMLTDIQLEIMDTHKKTDFMDDWSEGYNSCIDDIVNERYGIIQKKINALKENKE